MSAAPGCHLTDDDAYTFHSSHCIWLSTHSPREMCFASSVKGRQPTPSDQGNWGQWSDRNACVYSSSPGLIKIGYKKRAISPIFLCSHFLPFTFDELQKIHWEWEMRESESTVKEGLPRIAYNSLWTWGWSRVILQEAGSSAFQQSSAGPPGHSGVCVPRSL